MVCVAAFIVLCLISVFVAVISIFRRDIGKRYWAAFKKAWGCVFKRMTFQKCETGFKEDIKNSVLKKVVLKKPKLVKPISVGIEILAVVIVIVSVWSIVEVVKGGLALWTIGTCNVTQPENCALGGDMCGINTEKDIYIVQWFKDWGVIFAAIPDKFKTWDAADYVPEETSYYGGFVEGREVALDIFDPSCQVCMASFKNQLSDGVMDKYNVAMLPYAIKNTDGEYRFQHSGVIVNYLVAMMMSGENAWPVIEKLFTEFDDNGVIWQSAIERMDGLEARALLDSWVGSELQFLPDDLVVEKAVEKMREIVDNDLRANGIPVLIYDGKKTTGLYKP